KDSVVYPSGEEVITYHWASGRFGELDRVRRRPRHRPRRGPVAQPPRRVTPTRRRGRSKPNQAPPAIEERGSGGSAPEEDAQVVQSSTARHSAHRTRTRPRTATRLR
ncbi:hypothetical protein AB0D00_25365, partial [Streptomyces sp. NPDC048213]